METQIKLLDFQKIAYEKARGKAKFVYNLEMRLGKSYVSLYEYIKDYGENTELIVVSPNGKALEDWQNLINTYCPNKNKTHIINIEGLIHKKGKEIGNVVDKRYKLGKPTFLIIDEVHRFGRMASKQSLTLFAMSRKCSVVRCLSGTPIRKGIETLYNLVRIVNPTAVGNINYKNWINRFCCLNDRGSIVDYKNENEAVNFLQGFIYSLSKKDLGWDSVKTNEVAIDIAPEKLLSIKKKVDSETLVIDSDIDESELLKIILSKVAIYKNEFVNSKLDTIKSLIGMPNKNDNRIVLWTSYLKEQANVVSWIQNSFSGCGYGVINGKVKVAERNLIIDQFNNKELEFIVIMNSIVEGYSLNADKSIFVSTSMQPVQRLQAIERINTIERKSIHKETYEVFVKNSFEEVLLKSLIKLKHKNEGLLSIYKDVIASLL